MKHFDDILDLVRRFQRHLQPNVESVNGLIAEAFAR